MNVKIFDYFQANHIDELTTISTSIQHYIPLLLCVYAFLFLSSYKTQLHTLGCELMFHMEEIIN